MILARSNKAVNSAKEESKTHSAEIADEASEAGVCKAQSQDESETSSVDNSELETSSTTVEDEDDSSATADPVASLQTELKAERDKYLRLAAEYDNFRKRSAKERETRYNETRADTITRLLPVYDNLERALKMECSDEAFYKGIELTMTQLTGTLESMGVTKIPAVGEPFDPNHHNAVMAVENPDLGEKIVAEEYQTGFMLGERVMRHSTVVVAN